MPRCHSQSIAEGHYCKHEGQKKCLLRNPEEGGSGTSPLHSRGSPNKGGPNQNWPPHPYLLRGRRRRKCYVTPAFSGIPNAKRGEKIRSGCLTPAFSRARKRAKMLCHPCILGGPQTKGDQIRSGYLTPAFAGAEEGGSAMSPLHSRRSPTPSAGRKSEVATSPLPSRGPKRGRKCYVTPAFLGIPNAKRGEKIRIGCLTPDFSRAQKTAEMLRHPCILGGPQTKGEKIRSGYLTPAFSGGQKRAGMLCHPCILGDPQTKGLARQAQITIKLAMQPADWVRRIHRTTHPVHVNRKTRAGRPQVPETLEQALLVNTSYTRLTPQKLDQCRRIVTKQMRLQGAHIKNKFQSPQDSTRLRTLLVRRLLNGHR